MRSLRKAAWCAGLGAWAAGAWAQVPPPAAAPPASLAAAVTAPEPAPAEPFVSTGSDAATAHSIQLASDLSAGHDALNVELPAQAAAFFRDALTLPDLDDATKDELNLDLTTAYLAQGLVEPAGAALKAVKAADKTPAYLLRESLWSARTGNWPDAAEQIARVSLDSLSPADRPWFYGVQALIAEQNKDAVLAATDWKNAEDLAGSSMQKAQFELALEKGQILLTHVVSADRALSLEKSSTAYSNPSVGAQYAQEAAIVRDLLGQHQAALDLVNTWLGKLPDWDHENKNAMRLLFAMLDEEDPATANPARAQEVLKQILQDQLDAAAPGRPGLIQTQEIALFMLFRDAKSESDRQTLKTTLESLVKPDSNHPLLEEIYLLKAHLLLGLGDLEGAKRDAQVLIDKYRPAPGAARDSSYEDALRLHAYIATQQKPTVEFRVAARDLNQLRQSLPDDDPESKAMLGLVADLEFSAGDFSDAATLYKKLMNDPAPLVPRGTLLWHTVLSDLAGSPPNIGDAIALLNEYADRPDIDVNSRSMAEWNVLMKMRDTGHEADALARLQTLLNPAAGKPAPPLELSLRLRWMGARLAVEFAEPPVAVEQAAAFKDAIPPDGTPGISPALRADLMASALLFCGEAAYRANSPTDGETYFVRLRADYNDSEAAALSLIDEADTLFAEGKTPAAWQKMNDLADNHPKSSYVPLARIKSALYANALGKPESAIDNLKTFVSNYPGDPLIFKAQLLLGESYRKSGQFSDALDQYQSVLIKIPADNPLVADAEMGQAYCLLDQAAKGDASAREKAREALDRLVELATLPVDARVEAGYRLGKLLELGDANGNHRDLDGAAAAYFKIQLNFLRDEKMFAQLERTPNGRYWMELCMSSLSEVYRKLSRDGDARIVDELMKQYNLRPSITTMPGVTPAAAGPAPSPPPAPIPAPPASTASPQTPAPSPPPTGAAGSAPVTPTTN